MVNALHTMEIVRENSTQKVIESMTCFNQLEECLARTCDFCISKQLEYNHETVNLDADMVYMKWETIREKRVNEKTMKPIVVSITKKNKITCKVQEGLNRFAIQLEIFMAHELRVFHQKKVMKSLTSNLATDELVVLMDFSENYACKYATEVHSMHFGASRE